MGRPPVNGIAGENGGQVPSEAACGRAAGRPLRVVVAPDSFKGTLGAAEAAEAIAEGLDEILPAGSSVECVPMADGGEGTVDAWIAATGAKKIACDSTDPLGRPVRAHFGYLASSKTAVVELAAASGLPLLAPEERDPTAASTAGTGLVLAAALDRGARRVVLALGGSATNDGGAGMVCALGARAFDASGAPFEPRGAAGAARVARLDLSGLKRKLREREIALDAACDVSNPLCGPAGASAVFGPQKCALSLRADAARLADAVRGMDAALASWARAVADATGRDLSAEPGAGAAGGAGFAAVAILGGTHRPGAALVADAARLAERVRGADWVVTGEGALDEQTFSGKTPAGVAAVARAAGARVAACCGRIDLRPERLAELGVAAAEASSRPGLGLPPTPGHARLWLRTAAKRLAAEMAAVSSRAD